MRVDRPQTFNLTRIFCALLPLLSFGCSGRAGGEIPSGDGSSLMMQPGAGGQPGGEAGGGALSSGGVNMAGGSGSVAPVPGVDCGVAVVDPGPAPLQRLSNRQIAGTLSALFGEIPGLDTVLPVDPASSHLGLVQADVAQIEVENYQSAAELVAAHVGANAEQLAPCAAPSELATAQVCFREFAQRIGTGVYRSPVTDTDLTALTALFDLGFGSGGYGHGVELALSGMLQSPRFLYRPELGDSALGAAADSVAVPLSDYELATRLAFGFWNQGPDAELLAQAEQGLLRTEEGLLAAAQRLMDDPRGDESFRQFFHAWFGVGELDLVTKDPAVYPAWSEETAVQMRQQADAFFDQLLFAAGDVNALFTAPTQTFAPAALSDWYAGRPADGVQGLLSLPALLAVHSKPTESFPIYRGLFVREQLLCAPLPPPPPNVGDPPMPAPGLSTRERFEQHSSSPACSACHRLIDPLGFAFENYDGIGRYRTEDQGVPVNTAGTLVGTDVDGDFSGPAELAQKLAMSDQVRQCAARQWFRYVMQRFDQNVDACSVQPLAAEFAASGAQFASLRPAIVKTPAFRLRRRIAPDAAAASTEMTP